MSLIYGEEIPLSDGWVEVSGDWKQESKDKIHHLGKRNGRIADRLYINKATASDGSLRGKIKILTDTGGEKQAQLVFRYVDSENFYLAGISGWRKKFTVGKRTPAGWMALSFSGEEMEVELGLEYDLNVTFMGARIEVYLNEVRVIKFNDNVSPYFSGNVGLRTWGQNEALFENVRLVREKPLSFVLMPFHDKYRDLYENFIKKLLNGVDFETKRADEIFGNRPIIQDIIESIQTSRLIVAFVTKEMNPNVLYEIGVAHALNKGVIILTDDVSRLPFDIKHLRCIQYDDSLAGGEKLRNDFRETVNQIVNKHL